ncbi:hypothetical protein VKT23_010556 [Stygiomarasmius scandens]|uniref:F-box domain-containing protein n=1 Tax=Marasmiellus scandens TaxID=2682957 RepID=A0ABR1JCK8_9AGAR
MANHSSEFPPEIVEKIIQSFWTSNLSSSDRVLFMTACPLLNRTWKYEFSRIVSRDIHMPRLGYLLYLANIAWGSFKSLIYTQLDLKNRAETMTCAVDLRSPSNRDKKTEDAYLLLSDLATWTGYTALKRCFPSLKELRLKAAVYTPLHLWTSEMPQVVYTQIVLNLEEKVTVKLDIDERFVAAPRLTLNISIHDSDAHLGVTDALWKYRASPISGYLEVLVGVVMGGLMGSTRLCNIEEDHESGLMQNTGKPRGLSRRLQQSRRLQDSDSIHFFSTTALVVYADCGFISQFDTRFCRERDGDVSHSVCSPLCSLKGWFWSASPANDSWDSIIPDSDSNPSLRWLRYPAFLLVGVDLDGPCRFRAVQDLRWFVENNCGHDSWPAFTIELFGPTDNPSTKLFA